MKKRILAYRKRIDELLLNKSDLTDWNEIMSEHLTQIGFFQHERLIHLIVTVTFAILTVLSLAIGILSCYMPIYLLTVLLVILLVPYVFHYYLLENEVQKMYIQYDEILKHTRKQI